MAQAIAGISGTGTSSDPYLFGTLTELQTIVNGGATDDDIYLRQTADISTTTWTTLDISRYTRFDVYMDGHTINVYGTSIPNTTVLFEYNAARSGYARFRYGTLKSHRMIMHNSPNGGTDFEHMDLICTNVWVGAFFQNSYFEHCGIVLDAGMPLSDSVIINDSSITYASTLPLFFLCDIYVYIQNLNGYPLIDNIGSFRKHSIKSTRIQGTLKCKDTNIPSALLAYDFVMENSVLNVDVSRISGDNPIIVLNFGATSTGVYNTTIIGAHAPTVPGSGKPSGVYALTYNELTTQNVISGKLTHIDFLTDSETPPAASSTYWWGMYACELPFPLSTTLFPVYPVPVDYDLPVSWAMADGEIPYMPDFPAMITLPPPFAHIFIGDDPVDAIYRGDTQLTDIYVGNTYIGDRQS